MFFVVQLPSATVTRKRLDFTYDARGRRITKSVSIATGSGGFVLQQRLVCLYDGWNMIAEIDTTTSSAQLLRSYEWGTDISGTLTGAGGVGGLLVERFHAAATPTNQLPPPGAYAPLYDGNGNITELVNLAHGSVSARYEYGAFGETISMDGVAVAAATPFRFSTKYVDVETGLYNYGYRYYDAVNGRWLNRDPIEEEGGENLYAMVHNDAVNRVDVLGQFDYPPVDDPDRRDRQKQRQIETELVFDVAVVFMAGATWDDVTRAFYNRAEAKLKASCNKFVANGVLTELEAAAMYTKQRNMLVEQFRSRSTPVGKYIAEAIKPKSTFPSLQTLLDRGKTPAKILADARTNKVVTTTVGKFARASQACGGIALVFSLYDITTSEPAVRPRKIAGHIGGFAGGVGGAWAIGEFGGWAGTALAGPPGGAVGATGGAIIGGIGGAIVGELAAFQVYEVIVLGDAPLP
jgi:RHS repeat-associated protein